jgi:hypothetical protein
MLKNYIKEASAYKLNPEMKDLIDLKLLEEAETLAVKKYLPEMILFHPHNSSLYSTKFAQYGINSSNSNKFINTIIRSLGISKEYFFTTFTGEEKKDLIENLNFNQNILITYVGDSLKASIYRGIRNSLAHGNMFKDSKGRFYFISFASQKNSDKTSIKFLLSIDKISKISAFTKTLEGFKKAIKAK